ncbi:acetylornithine deacetylase [Jannaschia pagri]|uniref:Acetylornithine deacetylase n=1 Tax=Jannaschia pagri TaxID=2829797 RepID=A0ABQ4NPL1_9RHOB|nr:MULTISPECIES: acetylornithine deacetylase [unclassified Jannaschia]GIT92517.1 acetylornithine deacetylase [Jannaschia sp. AI_61]GIT96352.1 acetylornithine deacetylase [Jannaschia sp. AI_62]
MTQLSARAILDRLVSFPTVSRDSNLDLVDWVEHYLGTHGVSARRVYDATGTKAALYANVGPEVPGGVVLSGHTDVVPVDGQDWTTDPWTVTERDGKLFGRGTCDMKGFDALALAMVPYALDRGITRPLQLAFSYDEEIGCVGAPPMIDDMVTHLPRAAAAIIGEPTLLRPVTGHNASVMFRIHVHGFEVHSSKLPEGVSAIHEAGRILHWVNEANARIQAQTPDPVSALFDPPFTTVHVGMIQGGTAHNITAKDCHLNVGFRCPAGDDPETYAVDLTEVLEALDASLRARHPKAGVTFERNFGVPGLRPEAEGTAETLIRRLTGDNAPHVVTYGTEAGQFQERGYSAVVCGPGDIAQAHQPDEWIAKDQFEAGEALLRRVVDTLV